MDEDILFLRETLVLARKGLSWTYPNPVVGAVVVKNGKVIGKGYHKRIGLAHAEIEALNNCKENPRGATLYINLEPCIHFGKTPPCVDSIIRAKIKKVVFSTFDPNPKVNGQGFKKLQKANIEVLTGLLEFEARKLNEAFFTFHTKNRPFIAIKFAASLDGKIATYTGDSKWITNEKARKFARKLRDEYQAVLVGINTVLKDNPHLGVRMKGKKDPLRVIIGSRSQIPDHYSVFRDKNVLIINPKSIEDLLSLLKEKEIISVLVEGGGKTLGKFVDAKKVDKIYAFHAPIIIGGERAISAVEGKGFKALSEAVCLKDVSYKKFGDNILTIGYPA